MILFIFFFQVVPDKNMCVKLIDITTKVYIRRHLCTVLIIGIPGLKTLIKGQNKPISTVFAYLNLINLDTRLNWLCNIGHSRNWQNYRLLI